MGVPPLRETTILTSDCSLWVVYGYLRLAMKLFEMLWTMWETSNLLCVMCNVSRFPWPQIGVYLFLVGQTKMERGWKACNWH